MEQIALTLARRNDPLPSHEAAADLVGSGAYRRQCDWVFSFLRREPYVTALELGEIMGDRDTARKRLNDLRKAGRARVIEGGERKCRVSGKRAQVWRAVG